jgi:hypothetical protein
MREWNLSTADLLSLTIAADARLGATDYHDDQIWELNLGGGDPPAIAIQTTYGLRARIMRVFPRFTIDKITRSDPSEFNVPPSIHKIYPNFISLSYSPFPSIDVISEYWVPTSQGISGRIMVTNNLETAQDIRIDIVVQLTPIDGKPMAPTLKHAAQVLSGFTGNLAPIVFLTGGAQKGTGSYPSLVLSPNINPGKTYQFTWTHAAQSNPDKSFTLARSIANRKWDAEQAYIELLNEGNIEIHTGNANWDTVFMLTQKLASELFIGPTEILPNQSFVLNRCPDQGFSLRGNGSDYNHLWNGQTPLETYFLISLILPNSINQAKGLFYNFLDVQTDDGFIDWKPGLGGQRSHLLATPILSQMAWRIYEFSEDRPFLEDCYQKLVNFVMSWFSAKHDRDNDGIPEWDHPIQTGSDEHALYSHWHDWSMGIDITTIENPALCAFLYRECDALSRIATLIDQTYPLQMLETISGSLKKAVEASWDSEAAFYFDWDRDTHHSSQLELLGGRNGPGIIFVNRTFTNPIRLLIHLQTIEDTSRELQLFIHGTNRAGNHIIDRIKQTQFKWHLGKARLTSAKVYSSIEHIEIRAMNPADQIQFYLAGTLFKEQSTLLPLWAGIPDKICAKSLIDKTITEPKRFWRKYGLLTCTDAPLKGNAEFCHTVNIPWNALIGEGLIKYGYRNKAAELVSNLMSGIIQTFKESGSFRRYYHADDGYGFGERDILHGLAPIGLFMETLGVRIISQYKVALEGANPFPWPVTLKYRGVTVIRGLENSTINFPDGSTVETDDPSAQVIIMKMKNL